MNYYQLYMEIILFSLQKILFVVMTCLCIYICLYPCLPCQNKW